MERCNSIFGQILQIFSKREFFKAVYETKAAKGIKGFGVWDHFVAMLFCQLGKANSLREICGGSSSAFGKVKHLGIRKAPKRSTLAYANEHIVPGSFTRGCSIGFWVDVNRSFRDRRSSGSGTSCSA